MTIFVAVPCSAAGRDATVRPLERRPLLVERLPISHGGYVMQLTHR